MKRTQPEAGSEMISKTKTTYKPEILAPAGNRASFLAAVAAGADAVYCGLKLFSARMAADNFDIAELARLARLARDHHVRIYIAFNTMLKPDEVDTAAQLLDQVCRYVRPEALIVQDPAFIRLARMVGFDGELHLSTLANVSFPAALSFIRKGLQVDRVVLPRELSVDEIKAMAEQCPKDLSLEVFVHGALCYGVSGRCYWSSFLGGRSGLRGQCVQPCRRVYRAGKTGERFFSCQDFSLDVLAKVLLSVDDVGAWKIEGRKKGPHYVYSTVAAYRLFRDHGSDPSAKKEALGLLENSLGRTGTHYNFLSQRPQAPVRTDVQTGSGRMAGKIQGGGNGMFIRPRFELMNGDMLRIGYEDAAGHQLYRIARPVPKNGRLVLKPSAQKKTRPGLPVFLIDRREPVVLSDTAGLAEAFESLPIPEIAPSLVSVSAGKANARKRKKKPASPVEMVVRRTAGRTARGAQAALWLASGMVPGHLAKKAGLYTWWLPPVVWPGDEKALGETVMLLLDKGARRFVLNAPWQAVFFPKNKKARLWCGPFCNIANPVSVSVMAGLGFEGVIVSPELSARDYRQLASQSTLPLGIVLSAHWPLCVSRTISADLPSGRAVKSPKGEQAWVRQYGNDYWVFPNWRFDISRYREQLAGDGFSLFVHMEEPVPDHVQVKERPGLWNWKLNLV